MTCDTTTRLAKRRATAIHASVTLRGAFVQMWGEDGDRQAPKAPEVVAVGVGGGPVAGSMLPSNR